MAVGAPRRGVAALRSVRSLGQITAAGSCFGLVAALTKLLVTHCVAGDLAAVAPLAASAMLTALVLGGWWAQQAHAGAPTEVVVAGLTVIGPLVAVGIGAAVLGEAAGAAPERRARAVGVRGRRPRRGHRAGPPPQRPGDIPALPCRN